MDYNNKLKPKGMPQGAVPLDQVQVSEGEKHNREVMAKAGVNNPEAVAEAVPESQEPAAQPAGPQITKEIRDVIANFIYVSEQMYIMSQSGQGKVDQTEALKLREQLQKLGVTMDQIKQVYKDIKGVK